MNYCLLIDAALNNSFVAIAHDNTILAERLNNEPQQVSSWLHVAIDEILKEANITLADLKYIAVAEGPGSYTGLRIAMSAAKGLCYATNKPMITVSNLALIVAANYSEAYDYYLPMIDARRNEVFTAEYNREQEVITPLHALILEPATEILALNQYKNVCVCGNGAHKIEVISNFQNASIQNNEYNAHHLLQVSMNKYNKNILANLAYAEPTYGKPFYFNK